MILYLIIVSRIIYKLIITEIVCTLYAPVVSTKY